MLEVRENETSLRKLSGGTAQLHTLEGTLLAVLIHSEVSPKHNTNCH